MCWLFYHLNGALSWLHDSSGKWCYLSDSEILPPAVLGKPVAGHGGMADGAES